jgi:hypothetical protein
MADLFCSGQKVLRNTDSWYRTFQGYPKMSGAVKKMIQEFCDDLEYQKIMIFFTGHCGFDTDYSEFLLRELIAGNL